MKSRNESQRSLFWISSSLFFAQLSPQFGGTNSGVNFQYCRLTSIQPIEVSRPSKANDCIKILISSTERRMKSKHICFWKVILFTETHQKGFFNDRRIPEKLLCKNKFIYNISTQTYKNGRNGTYFNISLNCKTHTNQRFTSKPFPLQSIKSINRIYFVFIVKLLKLNWIWMNVAFEINWQNDDVKLFVLNVK